MVGVKEERLSRTISAYSRRKILKLMVDQEITVKKAAQLCKISVSLASRHLKMLYDLGFLDVRREFPHKFYSLKYKEMKGLLKSYDLVLKKYSPTTNREKDENIFRAISAEQRREIFRILGKNKRTVNRVAELTGMSVSLTSRYLKMLYDLGFLEVKRKFPFKYYSLKITEMNELIASYDLIIKKI